MLRILYRPATAVLLIFIAIQFVGYATVYRYHQSAEHIFLQWSNKNLAEEYATIIQLHRTFFRTIFEQNINTDEITTLIESAQFANSEQRDSIRAQLYALLLPLYQELKRSNIRQLQLHLPGNIVLLRLHRPDFFGDDLTDIRETVAYVDREQKAAEAFEQGRTYTGIRYVYPLFNGSGLFLGSAEVSASMDIIFRSLDHVYPNLQLLVNRDITQTKVMTDQQGKYSPSPYSDLLLHESTSPGKPLDIVIDNKMRTFITSQVAQQSDFSIATENSAGQLGIASFTALRNPLSGKSAGYLASFTISPHLLQLEQSYRTQQLWVFISISLIYFAFITVFLQKMALSQQLYNSSLAASPNRRALRRDLKKMGSVSLALININDFKIINDTYGGDTGNLLLKRFANIIQHQLTIGEYQHYHLGGDEFAVIHPDTSESQFLQTMSGLQQRLENEVYCFHDATVELEVDIAIGIYHGQHHLLERADLALREAKRLNKNLVVYTDDPEYANRDSKNLALLRKIRYALSHDQILAYYQPITDASGEIIKYEALVRMRDDDKILTPYFFLDMARKTRYYTQITHVMLENGFALLDQHPTVAISVNILADDILDEETAEFILERLASGGYNERITFEIVESQSIHDRPEVAQFLKQIKTFGALIAIDDFGSGYSNFSYLTELKPDYLKIDGSLIKDLPTNPDAQKVVRTIVLFAQQMQIKTIAEFVHSEEVLGIAKQFEIDAFQGFHIAKPAPFDELQSFSPTQVAV